MSASKAEVIDLTETHALPEPHLHVSDDPSSSQPVRRSTRSRKKTETFTIESAQRSSVVSEKEKRLEQFPYCSPEELGINPTSILNIRIHPVALALITFHAHLTKTEIIGYLGGFITEDFGKRELLIAEAFPAKQVRPSDLAKTGRSAFSEVEALPESTIEIANRMEAKGMRVVGWYHSHPDKAFTTEPSRVDIENQLNYQTHVYKDDPFVAAIIAPYNEDLPDHNPDVQFFRVFAENAPLQLPFEVCYARLSQYLERANSSPTKFPLDAFMGECYDLTSEYAMFGRRSRLDKVWRNEILGIDKLKRALDDLVTADDQTEQEQLYRSAVETLVQAVRRAWTESAEQDLEKQRQNNAKKRKKRGRQW